MWAVRRQGRFHLPCESTRCSLSIIWSCGLFEGKGVSTSRVSPPGPLSLGEGGRQATHPDLSHTSGAMYTGVPSVCFSASPALSSSSSSPPPPPPPACERHCDAKPRSTSLGCGGAAAVSITLSSLMSRCRMLSPCMCSSPCAPPPHAHPRLTLSHPIHLNLLIRLCGLMVRRWRLIGYFPPI
jgi:hypothetical protein